MPISFVNYLLININKIVRDRPEHAKGVALLEALLHQALANILRNVVVQF